MARSRDWNRVAYSTVIRLLTRGLEKTNATWHLVWSWEDGWTEWRWSTSVIEEECCSFSASLSLCCKSWSFDVDGENKEEVSPSCIRWRVWRAISWSMTRDNAKISGRSFFWSESILFSFSRCFCCCCCCCRLFSAASLAARDKRLTTDSLLLRGLDLGDVEEEEGVGLLDRCFLWRPSWLWRLLLLLLLLLLLFALSLKRGSSHFCFKSLDDVAK